jgi:SAM-dependent methyltransferase
MPEKPAPNKPGSSTKDRRRFQRVMQDCVSAAAIDLLGNALIVGGSVEDAQVLHSIGFRRITLSNIHDTLQLPHIGGAELTATTADVEDMAIADGAYDLVLAHEVLHHCRSPHKALLEMLRVSRKHVIILEPNESLLMRALVNLRFSFPYELPAVIANNFEAGGVRNTCIPNYIYRWNPRDMHQAASSYMPEHPFDLYIRRYWDFNVDKQELARRSETRIGSLTKMFSPGLFLTSLRCFQAIANHLPWLGGQGNKFFGCITKHDTLKPWLVRDGHKIRFNRDYGRR